MFEPGTPFRVKDLADTFHMIYNRGLSKNVLVMPGRAFMPPGRESPCPYMRVSFSAVNDEQLETAMERLAEMIREELEHQNSRGEDQGGIGP